MSVLFSRVSDMRRFRANAIVLAAAAAFLGSAVQAQTVTTWSDLETAVGSPPVGGIDLDSAVTSVDPGDAQITIDQDLTFNAAAGGTTITGNDTFRLFLVNKDKDVTLAVDGDLTLEKGKTPTGEAGAAIQIGGLDATLDGAGNLQVKEGLHNPGAECVESDSSR